MSERDPDAPSDETWSEGAEGEPAAKPPADGIRRIDTMIGSHLPGLLEEEALRQAATQDPKPEARAPQQVSYVEDPEREAGVEPGKKWKSPLQVGPDWLVALKSIPRKLVAIAVGGVAIGALLTLSMRGCGDNRQIHELDERVALLERTVGVSRDGGRTSETVASSGSSVDAGDGLEIAAPSATPATNDACAGAKNDAYAVWQDAVAKAKLIAGPAETQCGHYLTQQHKQSCMATASAGVRAAQSARDTALKGGAAARDAVKNVRDDARNGSIATAKAASRSAFAACGDGTEQ